MNTTTKDHKKSRYRNLRSKLSCFVGLTVPQYLIMIVISTISATLIINQGIPYSISKIIIPILSLSFAVFGLNALNQIYDLKIDSISKPSRPIPSGRISVKQVYILSLVFFFISIILTLLTNFRVMSIILFFIFLSIIYSVPPIRIKKWGLSSNIVGGTLYGAIPFLSAWAVFNDKAFSYIFFILFYGLTISLATTKDFEDVKSEKRFGIKTLPVRLGYNKAILFVVLTISLLLFFIVISSLINLVNFLFIYPALISYIFLYIMILAFKKLVKKKREVVITQAKIVTISMILVVLMELLFGVTAVFI